MTIEDRREHDENITLPVVSGINYRLFKMEEDLSGT